MSKKKNSTAKLAQDQIHTKARHLYEFGDAYEKIGGHIEWVKEWRSFFHDWQSLPNPPPLFLNWQNVNSLENHAIDLITDLSNRLNDAIESGDGKFFRDIADAIDSMHQHSGDILDKKANPERYFLKLYFFDSRNNLRKEPMTVKEIETLMRRAIPNRTICRRQIDRICNELKIPLKAATRGRPISK